MTNNKLYRSRNLIIAGVSGGLAEYFGLDLSMVRLAMLLLFLFGGLSLWVYIVLWIVVPSEPTKSSE